MTAERERTGRAPWRSGLRSDVWRGGIGRAAINALAWPMPRVLAGWNARRAFTGHGRADHESLLEIAAVQRYVALPMLIVGGGKIGAEMDAA